MNYIAIIGDIKDSKKLEQRSEIQDKLKETLDYVNSTYSTDIAANFIITLGDEFQGLLCRGDHFLEIVKYIQRKMYPVRIRFGVGVGAIHTEINSDAAIGADGPAYYAAREVIEQIHEEEKKLKRQACDIQIGMYDEGYLLLDQTNSILALMKLVEETWTDKQRYTIWDMEENGGSQVECAKRMDTTQSTVARRLADGNFVTYERAKEMVNETMKYVMNDLNK